MAVNMPPTRPTLPIPVRRALLKLGHDLRDARRRRRIPSAVAAARASVSRMTLSKVEKGDPGVAMGTCATVLFVLGLCERGGKAAAPGEEKAGVRPKEEDLPRRLAPSRKTAKKSE